MFHTIFDPQKYRQLLQLSNVTRVEDALQKERLELSDVAALLRAGDDPSVRMRVVDAAARRRAVVWNHQLFLMPPLYISDGDPEAGGCKDECVYCPWRRYNVPDEDLRRLSFDEIVVETQLLLGRGYGDIELVAATDPMLLKDDGAARAVEAAKQGGARNVGINFFPLGKVSQYAEVFAAGGTFAIVWQETYDPDVYAKVHGRGPKSNMTFRLDAHDRALQGGMRTAGVAFLGGLADWRYETLAVLDHALHLRRAYNANIIFGMPRLKGNVQIPGVDAPVYGDAEYGFVGALLSLAVPGSLPWFSTREEFDLSAQAAAGGGCMFTLDCSTVVGGYSSEGFAQFPVHSRDFSVGVPWLQSKGFDPRIYLPWQ